MLANRLRNRTEDHAVLGELRLKRRGDRNTVEHCIDRHTGQPLLLLDWYAELLEGRDQFGVDLIDRIELGYLFWSGVVADRLVVDRPVLDFGPVRLVHLEPVPE